MTESNPVEDVEALILDWSDSCSTCLFCVTLFAVEIDLQIDSFVSVG